MSVSYAEKQKRKLTSVLSSEEWTPGERAVVKWQFRFCSDFRKALWEAIIRADDTNLNCLALGFPDEVNGYLAWSQGDLATRLRKDGLDI